MPTLEDSGIAGNSGSSLTVAGIVPAGTNRYGIVKVGFFDAQTINSVTWGGVNITANVIKNAVHDGSNRKRFAWFYYLNPPASSADIVVTPSASVFNFFVEVEAWSGVDQTTPYENLTFTADGQENDGDLTPELTVTSATGDVVVDGLYLWVSNTTPADATPGAGQTEIQALDNGGDSWMGASYEAGAASVNMAWTPNATTNLRHAMYALSLNAAAGGDTTLAAALAGSAFVAAAVMTQISLAGAVPASASIAANLNTNLALAAGIVTAAGASGDLSTAIRLSVFLLASGNVSAGLATLIPMAASISAAAVVAADLQTGNAIDLALSLIASANVYPALATQIAIASSMGATSSLASVLDTQIRLAAYLSGEASLAAILADPNVPFASRTTTKVVRRRHGAVVRPHRFTARVING